MTQGTENMTRFRVLIADSTSSVRQFIRYTLQDHFRNLDFEVATNGKNVMKRIEGAPYNLILYDRDMPLLNGEDLLKWIRGHQTLRGTAVIMLAGLGDEESIRRAAALGVNGYLIKPLTQEALVNSVKQVLAHIMNGTGGDRICGPSGEQDPVTIAYGQQERAVQLESITTDGAVILMDSQEPMPRILEAVKISAALVSGRSEPLRGEIAKIETVDTPRGPRAVRCTVTFPDEKEARKRMELVGLLSSSK